MVITMTINNFDS